MLQTGTPRAGDAPATEPPGAATRTAARRCRVSSFPAVRARPSAAALCTAPHHATARHHAAAPHHAPAPLRATARHHAVLLRAAALLAALCLAAACGDVGGSRDPRPGDLLIADMDAGPAQPDGERLGIVFRARPDADGSLELDSFAEDARFREPVDVAVLPFGCVLILDQQWRPDDGPARGAIFSTYWAGGPVTLAWSDPRARQLVSMAYSRHDHTLYVSDRDADPLGLGQDTGCVFAIPIGSDGSAGEARIAAAGPELVTPGALAVLHDRRVLLMDADSNPRGVLLPDGRAATPGVLYELRDGGLTALLEPEATVSPIALIERDLRTEDDLREERRERARQAMRDRRRDRRVEVTESERPGAEGLAPPPPMPPPLPGDPRGEGADFDSDSDAPADAEADAETDADEVRELGSGAPGQEKVTLFLVDANEGTDRGVTGDGALFRVELGSGGSSLVKLLDSLSLGRPRAMVDPAGGDVLEDGRLVLADANADPLSLGEDGTGKGVYGTGRGALLAVDPDAGSVETLLASERFVSPVVVRRVR